MSEKKTDAIIYMGNFQFPMGDAVAKRALGIGKALALSGFKMLFIDENIAVPLGKISAEKTFEEFIFCSIHHSESALEHYRFLKDLYSIQTQVKIWSQRYNICAIVLCGMKCAFLAYGVISFAKRMRIPTIADSMDWLTSHTGNPVFDLLKQFDTSFEIKVVNQRVDGVVCISEYLANYYNERGKATIVVPPISPYERPEVVEKRDAKTRLVYAGVPCRLGKPLVDPSDAKDRLDVAIDYLYELALEGIDFEIYVYGLTKEQYEVVFPNQKKCVNELIQSDKLYFLGRQSAEVVKEAVIRADYTVLLRERNRTSMAGFPTKISESISLGTPVITTDTSDIKNYVINGVDAVFLDMGDKDNALNLIRRAINEREEVRAEKKTAALNNESFTPHQYSTQLRDFVREIQ